MPWRQRLKSRLARGGSKSTLRYVALAFVLSRAVVYLAFFLAPLFIPESRAAPGVQSDLPRFIDAGLRWDYRWYSSIVNHGYHLPGTGEEANVAFWPLYPLLVKSAAALTAQDIGLMGIIVSNAAFLVAIYYLYRLVALGYSKELASRTVLYLSFFPTSFFFSAFYSDAILLLGVSAAFYHQIRGEGMRAGIFGAAAALTHPSGALLALPMAVEALRNEGGRRLLGVFLVVLGSLAFPIYLYFRLGTPLAFTSAASGGSWAHTWAWPWDTLGQALNLALTDPWIDTGFLLSAVVTIGLIAITVVALRTQRLSFSLWALALLALYLSLPPRIPLDSMSRYALVFFPCFITLANWGGKRIINLSILAVFLPLLILLSAMFSRWFWVA